MIECRNKLTLSRNGLLALLLILIGSSFHAQENIYHGKIIKGDNGCPTLIKIKSSDNGIISHKIILPTGHLPADWQYGQKISFTMTPLRQPIPADCKAQVVASIQIMAPEKSQLKSDH